MERSKRFEAAVADLKSLHARAGDPKLAELLNARDEVTSRYQQVFATANLAKLPEEEFRHFLHFKNNRHWASLQRMGPAICSDMPRLRRALAILLDESRPIRERLDELVPDKGPAFVPHLGKAVITPILLISQPDRYGVWNQTAEGGMKALEIWPEFERDDSFGERYLKVNEVILDVARAVGVDLWTLDALWWRVVDPMDVPGTSEEEDEDPEIDGGPTTFGLERHLHEFLRDNWEKTSLGKEWKIYEEDGEPEAGYEYPCGTGRIDLLALHRKERRWLVIELKRGQSSDQTVGQVLRYMGWVRQHLAQRRDTVEGLVIAHGADESISYALQATQGVRLLLYEVDFRLRTAPA